jgi:outer membrane protein assembly factor BamB
MRKLLVVIVLLGAVAAAAATPDPVEGKWYGMAGPDEDRVAIGLELKRDAKQELHAYLFQPVINFYGLDIGALKGENGTYEIPDYGMSLTLADGKLAGTWTSLKIPIEMKRTAQLPSEVPVPDLPKGPGPLWQVKLAAPIWAPVTTRDGVAYVGTTGGVFHAVNVKDGSVVWTFAAGRPMFGGAAVTSDAVYFVCDNGYLFKLERKSGKETWRYDLGDGRIPRVLPHQTVFEWDFKGPTPAVADDVVYVGAGDGSFHAVDAATGQRVWRFAPPEKTSTVRVAGVPQSSIGKIRDDAAVDGDRVFFGSFDGNLYALDRKTGNQLWATETHARVDGSPVVAGHELLVGNFGGVVLALNSDDGKALWKRIWWGSAQPSTATLYAGTAYIGASDLRRVTAFEPQSGRVLWRTDVYGWPWGKVVATDGFLYVGVAGGSPYDMRHVPSFTAINRRTGKIAWRYPVPESGFIYGFAVGPAIDGKVAVMGAVDGTLYAFPAS